MTSPADIALLPDAGPLITLAYADALDLLFRPGWTVHLVDMVLHEVTRNQTPTSEKLAQWAKANALPVLPTRIFERHWQGSASGVEQRIDRSIRFCGDNLCPLEQVAINCAGEIYGSCHFLPLPECNHIIKCNT